MGSYIPNPRHVSPLAIAMFEFVGKLMGLSLRYKQSLPFTVDVRARAARLQMRVLLGWEDGSDALKLLWIGLQRRMVRPGRCVVFIFLSTLCSCCQCRPSVVWKQLLGQPLDIRDLEVLLPHFSFARPFMALREFGDSVTCVRPAPFLVAGHRQRRR